MVNSCSKVYRKIVSVSELFEEEKTEMFKLMQEFYDNVVWTTFNEDLNEKDYCILLYDKNDSIKGFSTQKIMMLNVDGEIIHGVFSGDTIIHKDYWGSLELYKAFAEKFVEYGSQWNHFYWFLISKGYKTYKMLPLFFNEFYPNYRTATPPYEQRIMHAFGKAKYPRDYDENSGVVCYRNIKDRLKDGVADITEKLLKDRDIDFFTRTNPDYAHGNDVVCLADLNINNIRKTARRLFLGR